MGCCVNCEQPIRREDAVPNFMGSNLIEIWDKIACKNCAYLYAFARQMFLILKDVKNGYQILQDCRTIRLPE